mgnify:CR=1 FL=1
MAGSLQTCKQYAFQSRDKGGLLVARVREFVQADFQIFTWPSALVLSCFLISNGDAVSCKKVIEIGAGNGLPSIVSAKLGATSCLITERDQQETLNNIRASIDLNEDIPENVCREFPLPWPIEDAKSQTNDQRSALKDIDVILGADVLYSGEDFGAVIETISGIMDRSSNENCVFYCTYQERSTHRTLVPHLDAHSLSAKQVS